MKTMTMTNEMYDAIIECVERHIERTNELGEIMLTELINGWEVLFIEIDDVEIKTSFPDSFMSMVRRNLPRVGSCYNYINVGSFIDDGERGYYADNEEFFEWENDV